MTGGTGERPVIAVWNTGWLPASQTFVLNQTDALQRWQPLRLGIRRVPDGLPVVPDRAPFSLSTAGRAARRLSRATGYRGVYGGPLRRRGARLVHAHFGPSAVDVLPIARRHRLPLVVTFHGYDVNRLPSDPASGAAYRRALTSVFEYATTLIAVSGFVRDRLLALGAPAGKVVQHYIGTPARPADEADATRSGVVFVGRLIEQKGVRDLIEAWSALPAELTAHDPLTLVGWGPLGDEFTAAAPAGVHLAGRMEPADVHRVLAGARLFCAPSKTAPEGDAEALGMVYLEAAQHGLPVVAYRHGGVPEAVVDGTTGLLAEEGDVAGLADRLHRLLSDPALAAQLGAAGRRRVDERFDLTRQTAELESIYDRAVASAG